MARRRAGAGPLPPRRSIPGSQPASRRCAAPVKYIRAAILGPPPTGNDGPVGVQSPEEVKNSEISRNTHHLMEAGDGTPR